MKITLAALILFIPTASIAQEYQPGFSSSQTCFRKQYRETYIPGTYSSPGYVRSWHETIEVPCYSSPLRTSRSYFHQNNLHPARAYPVSHSSSYRSTQSSACSVASSTTGGLLGGGLAAALSKKDAYGWSIPLGAVLGMGIANSEC